MTVSAKTTTAESESEKETGSMMEPESVGTGGLDHATLAANMATMASTNREKRFIAGFLEIRWTNGTRCPGS